MYDLFAKLGCELRTDGKVDLALLDRWIGNGGYHVVNAHHADIGFEAAAAAARHGVPMVYTAHYRGEGVLSLKGIAPHYISVSPPLQAWLRKNGIESTVVPNPIDVDRYNDAGMGLRTAYGIGADAPVLLYASRLSLKKGNICSLLLEAAESELFRTFPDLHVLIAGDGPGAAEIGKQTAKSKHRGRLHALGFVADMPPLYSMANAVVGTGRTALEAMACERVVIAVGVKGDAGIVAPSLHEYAWQQYYGDHRADWRASASSIAAASRLVLSSPELQRAWGRESRAEVIRRFERKRVAERLLAVFDRIRRGSRVR